MLERCLVGGIGKCSRKNRFNSTWTGKFIMKKHLAWDHDKSSYTEFNKRGQMVFVHSLLGEDGLATLWLGALTLWPGRVREDPGRAARPDPQPSRAGLLVSRLFIHEILGLNGSLRRISVPAPLFADAAEGKCDWEEEEQRRVLRGLSCWFVRRMPQLPPLHYAWWRMQMSCFEWPEIFPRILKALCSPHEADAHAARLLFPAICQKTLHFLSHCIERTRDQPLVAKAHWLTAHLFLSRISAIHRSCSRTTRQR